MNKQDKILTVVIIIFILIILLIFKVTEKTDNLNAFVYYEDDLILTIDLNEEEKIYEVDGYNGTVYISAGNGKVKVEDEDSPLHLCSKQGYISKSYETIVCLPNKIVVKIEAASDIDAIVK